MRKRWENGGKNPDICGTGYEKMLFCGRVWKWDVCSIPAKWQCCWKTGGTWWESTGKAMLCLLVIKLKNSWNLKHGKDRDEWPLQTWENAIKNTCTNHYKSMGWLGIYNFATWHPLEHHVATNCADRLRDVHDYYEECADWSSEEQASLESLVFRWSGLFWPLAGGSLRAELFASSSATQGEWKRGASFCWQFLNAWREFPLSQFR